MNFLAHAYLSFQEPDLIVGNIIADMIRGKKIEKLPFEIQQGVHLHRQIDTFTDRHPIVKKTKLLFEKTAGRYGGSFLDIAYDHFLARSSKFEPPNGWEEFAQDCYRAVESRSSVLPADFISLFLYMKSENWFVNYRHKWLIEKSFSRLQSRAQYLDNDAFVFQDFEANYELIESSFEQFFPDLVEFAKNNMEE